MFLQGALAGSRCKFICEGQCCSSTGARRESATTDSNMRVWLGGCALDFALPQQRLGSPQLFRFLVPEDRQSYERDGDDPENDVFGAVFFFLFSHKCSTAYMKCCFKCSSDVVLGTALRVLIPRTLWAGASCSP